MTEETKLRVQAWVDGELPPAEADAVLQLTQTDPEAAAVAQELRIVQSWLGAGEVERAVPESRDFYWSKIERALAKPEAVGTTAGRDLAQGFRWFRWLVPAGFAVALVLGLLTSKPPAPQNAALMPAEIDGFQDDHGTITFRSDSEQMTVVWVGNP